jgi:two-component system, cell cycle sensor histidine kinase and response regulator CckA
VELNEKGMLILIVDDEPDILSFLSFLMRSRGFQVLQGSTGEECLRLATEKRPDLILLDVVLPDINGIEVCKRIKANPELSDIFVMHLSARRTAVNNQVEGLNAGADGYITKPIEPDELLARVNALARIKRAEDARKESERLWRMLIDRMPIGCILNDADFCFTYWNPAAEKIFGYKKEEVIGKHPNNIIIPASSREYVSGIFERLAAGDMFAHGVSENITKEGRTIICEWHNTPLRSADGTFVGIMSMAQDITERKKAEEKIGEQAALLDIAQDAILVCSLDGDLLFWNRAAELLFDKTAEDAKGENILRLLLDGEESQFLEARQNVIEKGEWSRELLKEDRSGKEIKIESRWKLVKDDQGRPKSIFIINTDITEKKLLYAQILRAQRMESIGTLASGIAHDLNNVLAPTLLSIQILKSKLPDEQDQHLLDSLEATTKRGADLVKQVLSYARGFEGEHSVLQVKNIILDLEKIIKETFPRTIRVVTNVRKDLWPISGNNTQLHQVLMNLCVNSRDAMSDGGTLTISAENFFIDNNFARINIDAKIGPYILISVADTGIGIPRELLDRIFDPFFTTKEIGKGTGLGLSTVSGIVRSHGGFVNVYSELGRGSLFKIFLPAEESKETKQAEEGLSKLPLGRGESILIIDDEASIREVTKASLEAYGYRVFTASDGIEAVAIYAEQKDKIDVILLDMVMPIMDGPLTIRALRKILPEVKIIAVSGLHTNERMDESIRIGVKKFLLKPYTVEELLKALQEVLSPPRMIV